MLISGDSISKKNSSLSKINIVKELKKIEWDFPNRKDDSGIEKIHPYPAKFISDIPKAFLKIIPIPPNTLVMDPFCGSGSTLLESQKAGYPCIGIDLNPIACLISRVKTGHMPGTFLEVSKNVLQQAQSTKSDLWKEIPNVDHWFKPGIYEALASLVKAIEIAPQENKDLLQLALSSIIVRVSNQDSDTRYAAVAKNVTKKDVFLHFESSCKKLEKVLNERKHKLISTKVIESDILKIKSNQIKRKVGLIITSPPYPNAYEYWLYHKYRMWWLGYNPLAVKKDEIGARAHFFKKNHHTAEDFERQMRTTFVFIEDVLDKLGHICFVVGRSKIHGEIVDNAKIIEKIAKELSFKLLFKTERVISSTRKSFNLFHANIKTEDILVFRRI